MALNAYAEASIPLLESNKNMGVIINNIHTEKGSVFFLLVESIRFIT
jgi:hypothetical protein